MRIFHLVLIVIFALAAAAAAQGPPDHYPDVTDPNGGRITALSIKCAIDGTVPVGSEVHDGWVKVPASACKRDIVIISAPGFLPATVDLERNNGRTIILDPLPVSATVDVTGVDSTITETSASVLELQRQDLTDAGAATLDDKLRQVPGFSLFRRAGSRTANPTTQGVSLRGVGASGASRALVLSDGVPLNDPFGGWVYWGRIPAESINEVEIVRGPASDVYGTAAIGGVISVRTIDLDRRATGRFDGSYGNEVTPAYSFFGAIGEGPYTGSAGWERFWTRGFIPVAPEFRGPVDTLAGVHRSSFTPRIKREISEHKSVFVAGDFYRESRTNGTPLQTNDTHINQLSAGSDLQSSHYGVLTLRAYGGTYNYHQSFSSIAADRSTESLTRLQTVPTRLIGIRGQWTRLWRRGVYFVGGEARDIKGRSDETGFAAGRATVKTSAGGREVTTGLFGGGTMNLTSRLVLSGGLRFDDWRNVGGFSTSRSLINSTASSIRFADRGETRFSPRASALYRINGHVSVSATFASGFRQPTLNELYRSFRVGNIMTLANENLRAEKALDLEAAVIANALDGRLYVRTGPFCTRVDDPVSNVTLSVTPNLITRQRQNLGRTRTCGWEGDVQYRPITGLEISGGFLLVNPRVLQGTSPDINGLLVPQVPRQQYTAQARYSREPFGSFSVQVRGSGPQFEDDQNLLPLRGYVSVDAFASHQITHWFSIYVAGENLFDTRIEAGRTPVLTLAQPRTFRGGLRLRFE